jgi:carbon storage regulator CsrA
MGRLILTRRRGESILIYDPANEAMGRITVTQCEMGSRQSKIMIEAPDHVRILRAEVLKNEVAK